MGAHTTAGKVKIGLALDPHAYDLLKELAPGRRALGQVVEELLRAEAARRSGSSPDRELAERERADRQLRQQGERLRILHEIDRAILAARSREEIAAAAAEGVLRITDAVRVIIALWHLRENMVEVLASAGIPHPLLQPGTSAPTRPWPWFEAVRRGEVGFHEFPAADTGLWPEARVTLAQGIRSQVVLPLVAGGQTIGHLALVRRTSDPLPEDDLALAQQVADSLTVAVHHTQLNAEVQERRAQLQALSRRLVQLQEQERRALSRDLHDTSGQTITALKLGLGALTRAAGGSPDTQTRVDELLRLADTVSDDLHRLAVNLRPAALDRYGLIPALEQLLGEFRKQTGLEVGFAAPGLGERYQRLPGEIETALYRIVQESLTNVARYAYATAVSIILHSARGCVQIIVEDNGRGFDVQEAQRKGRLGLLGMRERAEMLGGTLEVESAPGAGCTIYVTIPLPREQMGDIGDSQQPAVETRSSAPDNAGGSAQASDPRLAQAAELARAKALSDAMVEIAAGMVQEINVEDLLSFVMARSSDAIGCDYAYFKARESDHWLITNGYRFSPTMVGRRLVDAETPAAVEVERTGDLLVLNKVPAGGSLADEMQPWGAKSAVSVPLFAEGKLYGVLSYVYASAAATFKPSEIEFLKRLGHMVSLTLENVRLREESGAQGEILRSQAAQLASLNAQLTQERDRLRALLHSQGEV